MKRSPTSGRACIVTYYELRTGLALEGKGSDQIAQAVHGAYDRGELPHRDAVTFAYMWSAH